MSLIKLKLAMFVTFVILFGTLLGLTGLIVWFATPSIYEISSLIFILFLIGLAAGFVLLQWLIAPYILRWLTNMREIKKSEYPWLNKMLDGLVKKAGLKKRPRLYIVYDGTPNAFAFGWTKNRAFIALHSGLIELLNKDEVEAVLAHEVGHVKHNDFILMTIASMVPIMIYYLIVGLGSIMMSRSRNRGGLYPVLVFIGGYIAQFLTYLIVLYLSRTREFYSDAFSAVATSPKNMRTALAKISYGFPIISSSKLNSYRNRRSFFVADPVMALSISKSRKGKLDKEIEESVEKRKREKRKINYSKEIDHAIEWEKTSSGAKLKQIFSTHPLTYRRIDALYALESQIKKGQVTLKGV